MASSEIHFDFNAGLPQYTSPRNESNPNITLTAISSPGNHNVSPEEKERVSGVEFHNLVDKNYPELLAYTCHHTHDILALFTSDFISYCDQAVNNMVVRRSDYFYTPSMSTKGGNFPPRTDTESRPCIGNHAKIGCGVFVQGPEGCRRSGEMMWWDYQGIRETAYCERTGIKFWDLDASPEHRGKLECYTKVDYVTECVMI